MNNSLNNFLLKQRLMRTYKQFGALAIAVLIFLVMLLQALKTYEALNSLNAAQEELNNTKSVFANLDTVLPVANSTLNKYSSNLAQIIPTSDNIFTIVKTLDSLASVSGCELATYSVAEAKEKSVTSKTLVAANFNCQKDTLPKLFESYTLSTGRFLTVNSALIDTSTKEINVKLDLVFYTFKAPTNYKEFVPLKSADLQVINTQFASAFAAINSANLNAPPQSADYEVQSLY